MKRKILLRIIIIGLIFLIPCVYFAQGRKSSGKKNTGYGSLEKEGSMELEYATQFQVDYYKGGYAMISIEGDGRFLVVPEDKTAPKDLEQDVVVLQQPIENIYLVSTPAMDLFRAIDSMDAIRLTGTDESGWYVEEAKEALKNNQMLYAGKYSAPDYEMILENNCMLAVENTMIYHTPKVKEQLEEFGIPVLVEHSSYESHPLGRLEWLKLYGVLLGKEEEAEAFFQEQAEKVKALTFSEQEKPTVAFFYITSNGAVNVRKTKDYVSQMIEMAGGSYIFQDLGDDTALSTVNMQMESFYAQAKDADYLIYNSTIDGELQTLEELLLKSSLLKDFKAVKNKNVWCTGKNMFQETTGVADMMVDINQILTGKPKKDELTYLYRLD